MFLCSYSGYFYGKFSIFGPVFVILLWFLFFVAFFDKTVCFLNAFTVVIVVRVSLPKKTWAYPQSVFTCSSAMEIPEQCLK